MEILCCCHRVSNTTSNWKELIPLISSIIVICLFIIDRIIGFFLRKNEVERSWYLKVLIEPNIIKIADFYKNVINFYQDSSILLKTNQNLAHNDYLSVKAKEFGKFQTLKRDFEADFIYPIQIRYPNIAGPLTASLLQLEDNFTVSLDKEPFSEDNLKDFQQFTAENKAILLSYLYSPIESKFFSFLK